MRFDGDYRERATLKDGRGVIIRLLRPADKSRLASGFNKLSEEGRYRRFLSAKTKLTGAELDYLTDVDQHTHFALGAVAATASGEEGEGLGVARFIVVNEPGEVADSAITVVDDAQGIGLGTLLFRRLAEAAVERGVRRFRGEVLATNEAMLKITSAISPTSTPTVSGGIAMVEFELPGATAKGPPDTSTSQQRELLRAFADGAAAIREFLAWRRLTGEEEE